MSVKHKTTIIGLDGAGFFLVQDWMKKGYLPNLKKIAEKGVFTPLNSSFIPITPIAWTSITTGKNAGKHGIFDWSVRKGNGYEYDIVSSIHCKADRLWNILNRYRFTTGVFNIPITYPPDDVNGFFISGFDTPSMDSDFTRPEGLKDDLLKNVKDYELFAEVGYTKGEEKRYADVLKRHLKSKRDAINFLLDRYDCDFNIFVVMELDHLHHKLWKLVEKESTLAIEVYALADEIVGDILLRRPNDNIFIISDHGGGSLEGVIYLNRWLMREGLLNVYDSPLLRIKYLLSKYDVIAKTYRVISKLGLGWMKRFLSKEAQEKFATSFISFKDIDWSKTKAFAMGEFGQIYINEKEKYRDGIVAKEEYNDLVESIISHLKEIRGSSGISLIDLVYRKDEVYSGQFLASAPDIICSFRDYAYDSSVKFGFEQKDVIGPPEFEDTGTHRREGIFFACGPQIKRTEIERQLDICDVTPTILYLFGCPIDKDMDGRVAEEIFKDDFKINNHIEFVENKGWTGQKKDFTDEDREEVAKKLRALGYMD
ncbi:MAG TPA: alkaline phosphatase family protein [Syntrophorhabdaceae bacterium]|nr:alkaline phosphatase family protein [Syntrophorhabdaceae bacterium]